MNVTGTGSVFSNGTTLDVGSDVGSIFNYMAVSNGGVVFVGLNVPGSNNNLVLNAKECSAKSARKM